MTLFSSSSLTLIAEIGVNHEGTISQAKRMLEMAAETGVNFVKFQAYSPNRYASANDQNRLNRVSKFALTPKDFKELSNLAHHLKVGFLCTPLSEDWVEILNPFCPAFKIASGDITFKPVIQRAAQTGKPLILSTGGSTIDEIDQSIAWIKKEVGDENLRDHLTLMHCVSAYPTPLEEANILSIPYLRERYGLNVGYSNHVIGMSACLGAVALGATIIEVHFTDQKEGREFRDHSLSFDQNDLRMFIQAAHEIRQSLGSYGKEVQNCEKSGVPLMRKGIIAAHDLKKGQILSFADLMFARPATEFSSNDLDLLIGHPLKEDVNQGYLIPRSAL